MRKRMLSLLLMVCMILPCVSYTAKAEMEDKEAVIVALMEILPVKELYGLGDVDFSALKIGNEISVYNYSDGTFAFSRKAYPLFDGNELVAVLYNVAGSTYQLMDGLAEAINETNCDEIAIVYDREGCYLFDGEAFYLILEATHSDTEKGILPSDVMSLNVDNLLLTDMSYSTDLGFANAPMVCSDESYSLNVPYVTQKPYNNLCWAASVACIVNYKKDYNYDAMGVASARLGSFSDVTRDISLVAGDLQSYLPSNTYTLRYAVPSDTVIGNNLSSGNPILGSFKSDYGGYHSTVIYGYSGTTGIFVMDPSEGWVTATKDSYMRYTYIASSTNAYMVLERAICNSWS